MYKPVSGLALFAALAAVCAAPASADVWPTSCANVDAVPTALTVQQYNAALQCLINEQRADQDLNPVKANRKLSRAAIAHSNSMANRSYFAHDDPGGASFSDRIGKAGYKHGAKHWFLGENIGTGTKLLGSPAGMVEGWMNSPEHRENILEPSFRDIGIGTVRSAPTLSTPADGVTITTDFGRRSF